MIRTLTVVASLTWAAQAGAAAPASPEAVVRATADALFSALDAERPRYEADPTRAEPLVEEVLLPNFDAPYAARLVLAKHSRTATPEQLARFEKAFVRFLVKTYAKAVVSFSRERLTIHPTRGPDDPKATTVQTEIARAEGAPIPVDYVLRQTPDGWKVFDVVIEGISYVRNYRQSFGEEIDREGRGDAQRGLEALIARLETGKVAAAPAKGSR